MNKYQVSTGSDYLQIEADDIQWTDQFLGFLKEGKVIALFKDWKYWKKVEDETECT